MTPIITLLTDYGTRDHYVAALKGVILGIAPETQIVDITHEVPPHDIRHAAFVLRQVWSWFPPGTIHVVVVDPGVGSGRRILLGRYAGRFAIAPDNGLFTFVHHELPVEDMHVLEVRRYFLGELSTTFHGRDIMAPAAAHLARGVAPREFGRATDRLEVLPLPPAPRQGRALRGSVWHVDRFGNLVTNISRETLTAQFAGTLGQTVLIDDLEVGPVRETYSDVPRNQPIAIIGSGGLLEIALNQGSAADRFGVGDTVRIEVRG